jgi:hypothetical protein
MTAKINNNTVWTGGKRVGSVRGNVFHKTIQSKHMLRVPPAIAFDITTLDEAARKGADRVKIKNRDTDITYTTTIDHIMRKGVPMNRGYGDQIYLPLESWQKSGKNIAVQYTLAEVA